MISTTTDPDGRPVVLDEHGWTHIKRRRPFLARSLREIMAVVREPDVTTPGKHEGET